MKYLSTSQASNFCKDSGVPAEETTLAKYRSLGGGPKFYKFGNRALYTQEDLEDWIAGKIGSPVSSTSELNAARG